jgi:hypothetical protein
MIKDVMCAGINRHEVEDERALRVKTSDLLGPESCADTARDSVRRRQGLAARGRTTENAQAVTRRAAPERGCHPQASRAIGLPGDENPRHPA